jgi:hypothetical protein
MSPPADRALMHQLRMHTGSNIFPGSRRVKSAPSARGLGRENDVPMDRMFRIEEDRDELIAVENRAFRLAVGAE